MADDIAWLSPWYPIDDPAICRGLEDQLRHEISDRHVLAHQTVRLIARREDTDDALFALEGGRIAEVHMTWSKSKEQDPRWPVTAVFETLAAWERDSMIPLHRQLSELNRS